MAPGEMHRQARIERACSLLAYMALTVSEVADAVGFANVHSFSHAFRQPIGVSHKTSFARNPRE